MGIHEHMVPIQSNFLEKSLATFILKWMKLESSGSWNCLMINNTVWQLILNKLCTGFTVVSGTLCSKALLSPIKYYFIYWNYNNFMSWLFCRFCIKAHENILPLKILFSFVKRENCYYGACEETWRNFFLLRSQAIPLCYLAIPLRYLDIFLRSLTKLFSLLWLPVY